MKHSSIHLVAALCGAGCVSSQSSPPHIISLDLQTQPGQVPPGSADPSDPNASSPARVAYYLYGALPDSAHVSRRAQMDQLDEVLEAIPGVQSADPLVPHLVVGKQRRENGTRGGFPSAKTERPKISALQKQANELSADLLVVLSQGYKVVYEPNGLVMLNALLLPMYFTPHWDMWVESYMEGYIVQPNTGEVLHHLSESQRNEDRFLTIYTNRGRDRLVEQSKALVKKTGRAVLKVIEKLQDGAARFD